MLRQEYQLDGNVEVDPPDLAGLRSRASGSRNTVENSKLVVGEADRLIMQSAQTQFQNLIPAISILSKPGAGSAAPGHAHSALYTLPPPRAYQAVFLYLPKGSGTLPHHF